MTPPDDPAARERYRRIADLFHRALELDGAERQAYLLSLRKANPSEAAEVESLVGAHGRAGDFIERPALSGLSAPTSGTLPPIPREPIAHYRVLSVVGQGGMGVVYLAEDTRLGRTVALKAVRPEFAADETRKARLWREARAAAALVHPNVATVHALEEIDDRLFLVSEFVGGETLREELARGPLAPARAIQVALAVLRALDAAHRRGIVHRDLKPENIVTTTDGDVKVLDFGLASVEEAEGGDALTKDGTALGTPAYMSPEQIRGEPVDGRSDLFAWGVLVVELVTGRHPFLGATPAATIARVLETPPATVRADADAANGSHDPRISLLVEWAGRCLSKRADSRPRSAGDILAAVEASASGTARVSPGTDHAGWWWQFHQAAATTAYGLLLFPLWQTRAAVSPVWGRRLFLAGLIAVVVSGMLRLHLWFARRQFAGEWATNHRLARRLVRVADIVFAAVLVVAGLVLAGVHDAMATLLVAAAASVVVSFAIIEPATTRAMSSSTIDR